MKVQIVMLTLAVALGGTVTALVLNGRDEADGDLLAMESLTNRIQALESQWTQIDQKLDLAISSAGPARELRISESDIQAAVERLLADDLVTARKALAERAAMEAAGGDKTSPAGERPSVANFLEVLRLGQLSDEELQERWAELAEAGLLDEAIAGLEELIEQDPGNADLQTDLGGAYLQKLLTMPEGPAKGLWAVKADGAFDQALEIDPQHWDARFSKAISLSFWPPLFGKQASAVSNFETLIAQQEARGGASEANYEQTYQFLGNLYQQQGNLEKAHEIWRRGLGFFPGSEGLASSLSE